jgi:hypothetical protein
MVVPTATGAIRDCVVGLTCMTKKMGRLEAVPAEIIPHSCIRIPAFCSAE